MIEHVPCQDTVIRVWQSCPMFGEYHYLCRLLLPHLVLSFSHHLCRLLLLLQLWYTRAIETCLGISSRNSGSLLTYLVSSFRNSATQLDLNVARKGFWVTEFCWITVSGNGNIVAPHGNMIIKKMADGKDYHIFSMDCLSTTIAKNQIIPRCSSCKQYSTTGNRFINRQHTPGEFVPHGARTNICVIANQPNQATHEIQRFRKSLLTMKHQKAEQVTKQAIASTEWQ